MGKIRIGKHRAERETLHSRKNSERGGQLGTQEVGSKMNVISGKTVGMTTEGEKNVDHIGRRPSGGEELELTVRNQGSTPGYLRGLPETERSQVDSRAVRACSQQVARD